MNSDSKLGSQIQYWINDTTLAAGIDSDRYEVDLSLTKYEKLCRAELEGRYLGTTIVIEHYTSEGAQPASTYTVAYFFEEDDLGREAERVDATCENLAAQSYLWLVPAPSVFVHDAPKHYPHIPTAVIRWACVNGVIGGSYREAFLWRVPSHSLKKFADSYAFDQCRGIHSASEASWIVWEDANDLLVTQLEKQDELLIVTRTNFGIELLTSNSSNLRISHEGSKVRLVAEHYWDVAPQPGSAWHPDVFYDRLAEEAQRQQIECTKQVAERGNSSEICGISLYYKDNLLREVKIRQLSQHVLDRLDELFEVTKASLRGLPKWSKEYERNEERFRAEILAPLLYKMGFRSVRHTHGSFREHGRDFVMEYMMPFHETVYVALQAKCGSIRGGTRSKIEELIVQTRKAFKLAYQSDELQPGRPESKVFISSMIVAVAGDITPEAQIEIRENIAAEFGIRGNVFFWDKSKILLLYSYYFGGGIN